MNKLTQMEKACQIITVARPCVRNELNRLEYLIMEIEKGKRGSETPSIKKQYLAILNWEADLFRRTLDLIDEWLPHNDPPKP